MHSIYTWIWCTFCIRLLSYTKSYIPIGQSWLVPHCTDMIKRPIQTSAWSTNRLSTKTSVLIIKTWHDLTWPILFQGHSYWYGSHLWVLSEGNFGKVSACRMHEHRLSRLPRHTSNTMALKLAPFKHGTFWQAIPSAEQSQTMLQLTKKLIIFMQHLGNVSINGCCERIMENMPRMPRHAANLSTMPIKNATIKQKLVCLHIAVWGAHYKMHIQRELAGISRICIMLFWSLHVPHDHMLRIPVFFKTTALWLLYMFRWFTACIHQIPPWKMTFHRIPFEIQRYDIQLKSAYRSKRYVYMQVSLFRIFIKFHYWCTYLRKFIGYIPRIRRTTSFKLICS